MRRGREQARKAVTRLSQTSLCNALCKAARVCACHHFKSLWFQKTPAGYGCLAPDSRTDHAGKGQSLLHIPSSDIQPRLLCCQHTPRVPASSSNLVKSSSAAVLRGLTTKRLYMAGALSRDRSSSHSCALVSYLMLVYYYFTY